MIKKNKNSIRLNKIVLMDKQGLARNMANLTGIVKTGKCGNCHDEFPLGELFPYDGKDLCESCLKEAEPENLYPVCCREIPETSDFCDEDCALIFFYEKSK